ANDTGIETLGMADIIIIFNAQDCLRANMNSRTHVKACDKIHAEVRFLVERCAKQQFENVRCVGVILFLLIHVNMYNFKNLWVVGDFVSTQLGNVFLAQHNHVVSSFVSTMMNLSYLFCLLVYMSEWKNVLSVRELLLQVSFRLFMFICVYHFIALPYHVLWQENQIWINIWDDNLSLGQELVMFLGNTS
ncbi:hypothetical protein ACJX0J_016861, partial [Zea mays]